MRVAVISDTHDRLPPKVVEAISDADEIWHLGDVTEPSVIDVLAELERPLRVVRGNCDGWEEWPLTRTFQAAGRTIHLEHIPPRFAAPGVDLLLHGHTHVPRDEWINGTRFLNPGSVGRANKGAPCSYAWLTLEAGTEPVWKIVLV